MKNKINEITLALLFKIRRIYENKTSISPIVVRVGYSKTFKPSL
jgi:hypothetical protein